MRQLIKYYLLRTLTLAHMFPTKVTDRSKLQSLLRTLNPISCRSKLVRLGPNGDGGYLVPDDLIGIKACFSPGVSYVSGFEEDCADLGMEVFLADKSVDGPATSHRLFNFTRKFVGVTSNDEFLTLDDWVGSCVPDQDAELLLQMDIEGYEYEVLLSASDTLMRRFRIIVVEFHQLDQLWSRPFFSLAARAFEKLLQTHSCVHIHPNNCCGSLKHGGLDIPRVMEFTFLRNDRITNPSYQDTFPNPLDFDNTTKPSLPLPRCWYRM
jgi:Methyltransferase FkbM domain